MFVSYYLVQTAVADPFSNFQKLTSALKSWRGLSFYRATEREFNFAYAYNDRIFRANLLLSAKQDQKYGQEVSGRAFVVLNCEKVDGSTVNLLKLIVDQLGYRIYDPELNCYLPRENNLYGLSSGIIDTQHESTMYKFGLSPVFYIGGTNIYYARHNQDKTIHLVNPYLLNFFTLQKIVLEQSKDFSYIVAPDLAYFVAMYDRGLIPNNFYQYQGKSTKIINKSGIALDKLVRKMMLKLFIYTFERKEQSFTQIDYNKLPAVPTDQLKAGEAFTDAIKRIINTELKLDTELIGVVISDYIEFDRDELGQLTPRLRVSLYLNWINQETARLSQRQQSWFPLRWFRR